MCPERVQPSLPTAARRSTALCCACDKLPSPCGDRPCVAATPARLQAAPPRRPSLTLTLTLTHRD
eukprot:3775419-Prymnesium_polylepis.1